MNRFVLTCCRKHKTIFMDLMVFMRLTALMILIDLIALIILIALLHLMNLIALVVLIYLTGLIKIIERTFLTDLMPSMLRINLEAYIRFIALVLCIHLIEHITFTIRISHKISSLPSYDNKVI